VIEPDVAGFDYDDFKRADELIRVGELACATRCRQCANGWSSGGSGGSVNVKVPALIASPVPRTETRSQRYPVTTPRTARLASAFASNDCLKFPQHLFGKRGFRYVPTSSSTRSRARVKTSLAGSDPRALRSMTLDGRYCSAKKRARLLKLENSPESPVCATWQWPGFSPPLLRCLGFYTSNQPLRRRIDSGR